MTDAAPAACELCRKPLTGDEIVMCTACSDRIDKAMAPLQPFLDAVADAIAADEEHAE